MPSFLSFLGVPVPGQAGAHENEQVWAMRQVAETVDM